MHLYTKVALRNCVKDTAECLLSGSKEKRPSIQHKSPDYAPFSVLLNWIKIIYLVQVYFNLVSMSKDFYQEQAVKNNRMSKAWKQKIKMGIMSQAPRSSDINLINFSYFRLSKLIKPLTHEATTHFCPCA